MRSDNIERVIPKVDTSRGAPMGRYDEGTPPPEGVKVYDKRVPMSNCGAYDRGGAYWGLGGQLWVKFTPDLSYIEFYRKTRR